MGQALTTEVGDKVYTALPTHGDAKDAEATPDLKLSAELPDGDLESVIS